MKELKGHHSEVMALQVDSERVVSAAGKVISIWDLETAKVNMGLEGHGGEVNCLQFDDKKVVRSLEKTEGARIVCVPDPSSLGNRQLG